MEEKKYNSRFEEIAEEWYAPTDQTQFYKCCIGCKWIGAGRKYYDGVCDKYKGPDFNEYFKPNSIDRRKNPTKCPYYEKAGPAADYPKTPRF